MTVASRERHRDMILNPLKWPRLVLPLVRRNEFSDVALFAPAKNKVDPDKPIKIYFANLWDSKWMERETKEYPNIDALLDDGWVVD